MDIYVFKRNVICYVKSEHDGKFPVVIVDQATGRVISVSFAEATTDWAIPGWVRFKVTINNVGANKIPCTMVFEQARVQNSQAVPSRVSVPFICN